MSDEQVDESKAQFLRQAKIIDNEARKKIYSLKLRLLRVESGIVISGTLIWGFGDWMVYGGYLSCTQ